MLLREKDRQTLLQIFSSVNEPIEVLAYGSRVTGSAHDGSDLDLAVRGAGGTAISSNILTVLINKIKESNIPILIELRNWHSIPKNFQKNIENQYDVLYRTNH
ncbi:hypothetical protein AGMMS49938_15760 [Fibrobacterales bacterium]|nr:hypothetical protein AGMMS49938_15760 [Fibrobacterales bacterium]